MLFPTRCLNEVLLITSLDLILDGITEFDNFA